MASESPTFEYPPLDPFASQIRLIHLQPRQKNNTLSCSLTLGDLDDDSCEYEALSYEWGDPNAARLSITMNGVPVDVRENLWWALSHLRHETETRVIWIDALCIDQENGKERNHQVQLMGRIYKKASVVVAWLGAKGLEDFTQRRITIKGLIQAARLLKFMDTWSSGESKNHENLMKAFENWEDRSAALQTLNAIFDRSYWQRLWIIQELVLASKIVLQYSAFQLPWSGYEYLVSSGSLPATDKDFKEFYKLRTRYPAQEILKQRTERCLGKGQRKTSLLDLFCFFSNAQCVDIRDKLYGLHSLASECCQMAVMPDYCQTASQVCQRLIEHACACSNVSEKIGGTKHAKFRQALSILKDKYIPQPPLLSRIQNAGMIASIKCRLIEQIVEAQPPGEGLAPFKHSALWEVFEPATKELKRIGPTIGREAMLKEHPTTEAQPVAFFPSNSNSWMRLYSEARAGDLVFQQITDRNMILILHPEGSHGLRLIGISYLGQHLGFGQRLGLKRSVNRDSMIRPLDYPITATETLKLYLNIAALQVWPSAFLWNWTSNSVEESNSILDAECDALIFPKWKYTPQEGR